MLRAGSFQQKAVLVVSVLLAVYLYAVAPRSSQSAPAVQYKVVTFLESEREDAWEQALNRYGREGWRVVGTYPSGEPHLANSGRCRIILAR